MPPHASCRMRELHFFADDLTKRYGHPLYRIPFDLHLSCPHRDRGGHGGCVFCAENGSRARHLSEEQTLEEQCRTGIDYARRRYGAEPPYIAYFQAFTSTNAPADTLRKLFQQVMDMADFKVMIVATRPDCLPDDTIELFAEWNRKVEVWIELGVQSACDETLVRINRGHDFACVREAVRRLHAKGIHTAAHVILGLPEETRDVMMNTARELAQLPFEAVKIHNLLILKGTKLAKMEYVPLNEYEYAALLRDFIHFLPEDWLLMRLSAEAEESEIIAPKWWMKKGQFLEFFKTCFSSNGDSRFLPCKTGDGSYTLYHPAYHQHFHSIAGAYEESFKKYVEPLGLEEKLRTCDAVSVLDIGFGLGFNAGAAMRTAETVLHGKLFITTLESDPQVIQAALSLPEHHAPELLKALADTGTYESDFCRIHILFGDARQTASALTEKFDCIFLDGFSPDTNPELWTIDFIRTLRDHLKPGGGIAAYSSAYPVIGAFLQLGMDLRTAQPFGRKRPSLAAFMPDSGTELPFPAEKDVLIAQKSTAGVPYRDPELKDTRKEIFARRAEETSQLRASGMPKWYRVGQV